MKNFRKIKRKIGRKLPPKLQAIIRRGLRILSGPVKNPAIPIEELKVFELLKDKMNVVFDVGAREDLSFYNIKNDCEYHLFEPNKKAISILKNKISLLPTHNIILNEFGLSDKNSDDSIYYEDSQSFVLNPFHQATDTGMRFPLRKLDDYVINNKIGSIDFLKIDAEGLDYKILLGGIETVKTHVSYIQFEYWDGVRKFHELLKDTFNLYLMMEPRLLDEILKDVNDLMTKEQRSKNYRKSLIKLDEETIDLIDKILVPRGIGGNILGVSNKINEEKISEITFDL